jgi:hypothetical protein
MEPELNRSVSGKVSKRAQMPFMTSYGKCQVNALLPKPNPNASENYVLFDPAVRVPPVCDLVDGKLPKVDKKKGKVSKEDKKKARAEKRKNNGKKKNDQ